MITYKKILFFAVILAVGLLLYFAANAGAQENTNKIYFVRYGDLWFLNLNTNLDTQMTNEGKYETAALSPNHAKAAYMSNAEKSELGEIFGILTISDTDGTDEKKYNGLKVFTGQYAWAPSNDKLAVISDTGKLIILNINNDGKDIIDIKADALWYPAWSPDGSKIALRASKSGIGDVLIYDMKNKTTTSAYESPIKLGSDYFPPPVNWSPDGAKIAFEIQQTGKINNIIYLKDLSSGSLQKLTEGFSPLFSYKENMMAFISAKEDTNKDGVIDLNDSEIYIYHFNNNEIRRVTNNSDMERLIAWSVNNDKILYNQEKNESYKKTYDLCFGNANFGTSEKILANAYGLDWEQTEPAVNAAPSSTITPEQTPQESPFAKKPDKNMLTILIILFIIILAGAAFNIYRRRKK